MYMCVIENLYLKVPSCVRKTNGAGEVSEA